MQDSLCVLLLLNKRRINIGQIGRLIERLTASLEFKPNLSNLALGHVHSYAATYKLL